MVECIQGREREEERKAYKGPKATCQGQERKGRDDDVAQSGATGHS